MRAGGATRFKPARRPRHFGRHPPCGHGRTRSTETHWDPDGRQRWPTSAGHQPTTGGAAAP
eukprot:14580823-Alexandrium_andersonii.AAC.1